MNELEFPALHHAADEASNSAQSTLLFFYKINNLFLILASIFALLSDISKYIAILSPVFFILSLSGYIYIEVNKFQGKWYQARALAESVKTSSWRLIMSVEPFNSKIKVENLKKFSDLLHELLKDNRGISKLLSSDWDNQEQVTQSMSDVINESLTNKKKLYLTKRIEDQRKWYSNKAKYNKIRSKRYLIVTCCAYITAIFLLFMRINEPTLNQLPIETLAVVVSSLIGWAQLRRFNDLASSYQLTAIELGIIKARFDGVKTFKALNEFVSDAESAFSREHTQWAARRDH